MARTARDDLSAREAGQDDTNGLPETGLRRQLTQRQIGMIGLGGAIGTGLFLGSGLAISKAGPATILSYVACSLVALVLAWALAEMVVQHPTAGAFGSIAHRYLGPWAGYVVRWTYWTIQVIAVGGELVAAGIYVQLWWPLPLWLPIVLFALLILGANAAAVRLFGTVEYWFAVIKVIAIAVFILLGVVLVTVGLPKAPATGVGNLTAHGGFFPHGIGGLLLATVFVLFSFIGTEVVSVTAAESENPGRDIPRAARRMILRLALFYLLAITLVLAVAPWTTVAQSESVTQSPFVEVFHAAGVPYAAMVMNFVVLTAALSSANTNLYLATRMLHSLAGHGYAPRWTARLARRGIPVPALLLSTLGILIATALSVAQGNAAYTALFGLSIFGALVVWILILVTHLAFRRRRAGDGLPLPRVRLRGAPLTTSLAILFLLAVLVSTAFIDDLVAAWWAGLPFFALLSLSYLLVRRRATR